MPESEKTIIGAVLVVGGGISGMQASLDLAEAGYKVYLVEKGPAIGGNMARLDKTFPTNDCAMCVMSPKLVDTGRHLNIEILTNTEIVDLEGLPGNFTARLKSIARYVDMTKCTSCGDCTRACPVELPGAFDANLGQRKAIYKLYAQATPTAFSIEKKGLSPCRAACPAGVNAQGYAQLIKDDKPVKAWALVYRDNPFPAICGRVCTHPCQDNCHRGEVDRPVEIMNLKRYAADQAYQAPDELPLPDRDLDSGTRIAVVGAGPGGLSCAYQLTKMGYRVTAFEARAKPGGMMRYGIPAYRLPKEWVDLETGLLEKLGIEIRCNTPVGPETTITDLLKQGFKAVYLSTGAHLPLKLNVPGEDLPGVMPGVSLLNQVNSGKEIKLSGTVAVIGGGNVAVDAARTALRLGAERVDMYSLENEIEMPASQEEIVMALAEGVNIHHRRGVKAVNEENGRVKGLTLIKVASVFDAQGRFNPAYVTDSEHPAEADYVIPAIGQRPDTSFAAAHPQLVDARGRLAADAETMATPLPGVFAGGDAVTGPRNIISAVAAGKTAAESIHRFVSGIDLKEGREFTIPKEQIAPFPAERAALITKDQELPALPAPIHDTPTGRVLDWREESVSFTREQAILEAARCLNCAVCSECLQCVEACLPGAINHSMVDHEQKLAVGAVILAPGFETCDPEELPYYGYGQYPNVISSMQFERILSASGPFQGHLIRPWDGKEPKRIAWIQCAGSRNVKLGRDYCSAVCCMYAIKEAVIAKEHSHDFLETTIFYMDMRTHGKDFERYYNRAVDEHGVRFVRSRIYAVEELPDGSGDLKLRYALTDGTIVEETFDLVVLSLGLRPPASAVELARAVSIETNEFGFCYTPAALPSHTSRPGVFVAGPFGEPKDIPETVVDASAAAANASRLLAPARGTLTRVKEYPPERDVSHEPPRVGVFVCNCGINIGSIVKVSEVVAYARQLRNVTYADEFLFTCSQDSVTKITDTILSQNLNRVVVASCTPRTHAPLFQGSMREAGLNPYLYEQANIREHCSWVHRDYKDRATAKARDLVAMAVAKARLLRPVTTNSISIDRHALVVGGGVAGMTAAMNLADQGYHVFLVEKEDRLGGQALHLRYTIDGTDTVELLTGLISKIQAHPAIDVYTGTTIKAAGGYVGNYQTIISTADQTVELHHGAVIVATGGKAYSPREYLYGEHPAVLTQRELEDSLARSDRHEMQTVVMIQCVGSRNEERPYCSRICCSHALKNALRIKETNPDTQVFILYQDLRSYGFLEQYYTRARQRGIIFIPYERHNPPRVDASGQKLEVTALDPLLGQDIVLMADLLALSVATLPGDDTGDISRLFKVPVNADGFLAEAHMKLRPVDFSADGLYLAGLAHAPKLLRESIAQANAAAIRATTMLSKDKLESLGIVATVKAKSCQGCGLCIKVCSYDARYLDEKTRVARVNEVLCQGCGACVAACPSGASQQKNFEKRQILAMIDSI